MMLAASSASGSSQYLFANTKHASASFTCTHHPALMLLTIMSMNSFRARRHEILHSPKHTSKDRRRRQRDFLERVREWDVACNKREQDVDVDGGNDEQSYLFSSSCDLVTWGAS